MFSGIIRKIRIWKINRSLKKTAEDLNSAVRTQDQNAVIDLEVRIHELGWEKEKLQ